MHKNETPLCISEYASIHQLYVQYDWWLTANDYRYLAELWIIIVMVSKCGFTILIVAVIVVDNWRVLCKFIARLFRSKLPLRPRQMYASLSKSPLWSLLTSLAVFHPGQLVFFPHYKKYGAKSFLWLILLTSAVYGIERRCTANLLFPDTTPCLSKAYRGIILSPASIHTNIGTPTSLTGISDSPTKLSKVYTTSSLHVFRR